MCKALRALMVTFYVCCAGASVQAQQTVKKANPALQTYQDSLQALSKSIAEAPDNGVRFTNNAAFIKTLVSALKVANSYNFAFDSLQMVSVIKSPDNAFKLFSWFLPTDEGGFRYFGAIQLQSKDGHLKLFPLIDDTQNFLDSNAVSDNKKWLGSRYYEIVPVLNNPNEPYYALLGWKGNDQKTTTKLIEILSFKAGAPVFGKAIFEGKHGLSSNKRIIFTYNKMNSMTLRYDPKVKMIVCDHLAPYDPKMQGNFEFYASDSSFDGYAISKGKLKLEEDIEVNNDPDKQDEFYIDPSRKDIPATKKF
jgi:hypothetical protein